MSKIRVGVVVSYKYDLEIDQNNPVVKDYDGIEELIKHLVDYKFSEVLPVINNGVVIKDVEPHDIDIHY